MIAIFEERTSGNKHIVFAASELRISKIIASYSVRHKITDELHLVTFLDAKEAVISTNKNNILSYGKE